MKLSIAGIIAVALLSGCASAPCPAPVVVNVQEPARVEAPAQSYATKYRNGVRTALLAAKHDGACDPGDVWCSGHADALATSTCGAWAEDRGLVATETPLDEGGYECIVSGLAGDACNELNATEYTDGTCGVWFNWSEM